MRGSEVMALDFATIPIWWKEKHKGGFHVPFRHNFNRGHCRYGAC
jgi:hypothetical protein